MKLRPSDSHRWLVCRASPGYVARLESEGRLPPQKPEDYTEEGIQAHRLAAALLTGTSAGVGATAEMLECVRGYVAHVHAQQKRHPDADLLVEQAVPVFYTDRVGYVDSALILTAGTRIYVNDYKHGRGVSVEALENPQITTYLLSLVAQLQDVYPFTDDTECILTIYQPRVSGEKAVREWRTSLGKLRRYGEEIRAVAGAILAAPHAQQFVPGEDQCTFCPAAPLCEHRARDLLGGADEVLDVVVLDVQPPEAPISPPPPDTLSPEQIARVLRVAEPLTKWIERVEKHALAMAQTGVLVPGYKVVSSKPGARRWKDAAAAEQFLRGMFPRGTVVREALVTAPQAEELMKTRPAPVRQVNWDRFNALIERPEGQPTLVPEDDPREPLALEKAEDHFDAAGEELL